MCLLIWVGVEEHCCDARGLSSGVYPPESSPHEASIRRAARRGGADLISESSYNYMGGSPENLALGLPADS